MQYLNVPLYYIMFKPVLLQRKVLLDLQYKHPWHLQACWDSYLALPTPHSCHLPSLQMSSCSAGQHSWTLPAQGRESQKILKNPQALDDILLINKFFAL